MFFEQKIALNVMKKKKEFASQFGQPASLSWMMGIQVLRITVYFGICKFFKNEPNNAQACNMKYNNFVYFIKFQKNHIYEQTNG